MDYRFYKIEVGSSALNLRLLRRGTTGQWEELHTYGWLFVTPPTGHTPITEREALVTLKRIHRTRPGMQDLITVELHSPVWTSVPEAISGETPLPKLSEVKAKKALKKESRKKLVQLAIIIGVCVIGLLLVAGVAALALG